MDESYSVCGDHIVVALLVYIRLIILVRMRKIIVFASVSLLSIAAIAQTPSAFTGKPPSLISASTPHTSINWSLPWYYFTLNLPADSPESLSKITITPVNHSEEIDLRLEDTKAFEGERNQRGETIGIKQVSKDESTKTIEIVFDPPVDPDTVFTIALRARRNPRFPGIYLYRVNVFPTGDNPVGLDLGVGRFTFYSSFW